MAWTDLSAVFGYGTLLTSSQMQQLRDNITALANGDSGAPPITAAALGTGSVGSDEIAADAVGSSEIAAGAVGSSELASGAVHQAGLSVSLQQNTGAILATSSVSIAYTGGGYSLMSGVAGNVSLIRLAPYSGVAYTWGIGLYNSDSAGQNYYFQSNYVNASAPYDLGFGLCHGFIYLMLDNNGAVIGYDIAESPPWINNGPTKVTADRYGKNNRQFINKAVRTPEGIIYEEVELTPEMKNADMDLIPEPWCGTSPYTIVLIDPASDIIRDLFILRKFENIGDTILKSGKLVIGSELKVPGPKGLMIVDAKWKNSP